jgi:hypothetical protein
MKGNIKVFFTNVLAPFLTVLFCAFILSLSIRGLPGNPTSAQLNDPKWKDAGPFELSPERGRFALTYSFVETGSVYFSNAIEQFAEPDVAFNTINNKFVSLFAPGISFMIMPGYMIGKYFGASQVGSTAIIAIFAIINVLLIRAIAMRLGAGSIAGILGGLVFLFATPAYPYAVTIYQHHISTFLILMSIYTLLRWKSVWSLAIIWFLFAASLPIDNPNLFFFLPIIIFATGRFFEVQKIKDRYKVSFKILALTTLFTMIIPVGLFLWFNNVSDSSPFKLSGSMKTASDIRKETNIKAETADIADKSSQTTNVQIRQKNIVGFFQTRNLLNGFYEHTISLDRGTIVFTPVMIFGIIGSIIMVRKKRKTTIVEADVIAKNTKISDQNTSYYPLLIAIAGIIFLLYSMWGDPYGGWAFGSRYMIPAYAILSIFIALLLNEWRNKLLFLGIFFILLTYSVSVNTLGAITSNRIPPRVEAAGLEKVSGKTEYYNYQRDIVALNANQSKSFVFQTVARNYLSAWQYYSLLTGMLLLSFTVIMSSLLNTKLSLRERMTKQSFVIKRLPRFARNDK